MDTLELGHEDDDGEAGGHQPAAAAGAPVDQTPTMEISLCTDPEKDIRGEPRET